MVSIIAISAIIYHREPSRNQAVYQKAANQGCEIAPFQVSQHGPVVVGWHHHFKGRPQCVHHMVVQVGYITMGAQVVILSVGKTRFAAEVYYKLTPPCTGAVPQVRVPISSKAQAAEAPVKTADELATAVVGFEARSTITTGYGSSS